MIEQTKVSERKDLREYQLQAYRKLFQKSKRSVNLVGTALEPCPVHHCDPEELLFFAELLCRRLKSLESTSVAGSIDKSNESNAHQETAIEILRKAKAAGLEDDQVSGSKLLSILEPRAEPSEIATESSDERDSKVNKTQVRCK